jgi:hypothetical protein
MSSVHGSHLKQRVGDFLASSSIRTGDGVDDSLSLFVADLLVVLDDVTDVITARVVGFADAHGVVREVDIAVVAEEWV